MIAHQLLQAFSEDLHYNAAARPCYLMALIDMAMLTPAQREQVTARFEGLLHPLLLDPDYATLQPLGAMLAGTGESSPAGFDTLIAKASGYGTDVIQAWVTSLWPPDMLAGHLSHATFAQGGEGERYLLRYYDPLVLPVLHRAASPAWVGWFFAPFLSWWFAGATPEHPRWSRIPGGARLPQPSPPALTLTDALWEALVSDPLPHQLLHTLEQEAPAVFASDCRGVRLTQIEAQLDAARQHGLSRHEDLTTYVLVGLSIPAARLAADRDWQDAVKRAVADQVPLSQSLAALKHQADPRRPQS